MKKEELILGKSYLVKSKEWFEKHKNENNEVVEDGIKFNKPEHCGKSMKVNSFDESWPQKGDIEMTYSTKDRNWNRVSIPPFTLESDPDDTKEISQEILQLAEEIKKYKYIFQGRNASGGGEGKLKETKDITIIPCFDYQGNECLQLPGGDSCVVKWKIAQVRIAPGKIA